MVNVIEIEGMKDLIEAVGGSGGGSDVPAPTSADRGKVLGVKSNADEFEYKDISEVPDSTGATNGDVLTKTASGLEWATPSSGGVTTFGGTTAEGTVSSIDKVGNIIEFQGNDISNIANLEVGDAVVQIYNNESYIYTIFEMTPSKSQVYCKYDNRVKVANSGGGLTTTTKVNFNNTTKRVDVTSAGLTNLTLEKTYIPYACFNIEYKDSDSGSTVFKDAYMPIPAYLDKIGGAVFVNFAHGQTNWATYLTNVGAIPSDATSVDVSGTVWVSYTP